MGHIIGLRDFQLYVKNRDFRSREGHRTMGLEAREYPRLSSLVTKRLTLREPTILLYNISSNYII